MFVQSRATTRPDYKDGLAIEQRRAGKETLVQWSNGTQQWCHTHDLDYMGNEITLVGPEKAGSTDG